MKLAEALALRADKQKRLAQIETHAEAAARYQEGEQPPESAAELLRQGRSLVADLQHLVRAINRTNSRTPLNGNGMTLTDAIAARDALGQQRKFITSVADAATLTGRAYHYMRQMRSELRTVTDVPVAELRSEADDLSRQHRELDVQIQQANWAVDLIEE